MSYLILHSLKLSRQYGEDVSVVVGVPGLGIRMWAPSLQAAPVFCWQVSEVMIRIFLNWMLTFRMSEKEEHQFITDFLSWKKGSENFATDILCNAFLIKSRLVVSVGHMTTQTYQSRGVVCCLVQLIPRCGVCTDLHHHGRVRRPVTQGPHQLLVLQTASHELLLRHVTSTFIFSTYHQSQSRPDHHCFWAGDGPKWKYF